MQEVPGDSRLILANRADWARSSNGRMRLAERDGSLVRVRRGVRQPRLPELGRLARDDRSAEARRRYLDVIRAAGLTRKSNVVFSHLSALAILGFPHLGAWPHTVDILEPITTSRRTLRGVVVHRSEFDASELVEWEGFFVTGPARTIADLARHGMATETIVALDFSLGPRAAQELRISRDDVRESLERRGPWGRTRGLALVDFADPRAQSPGESGSRVRFHELGFVAPELQVRHEGPDGDLFSDFFWRRPTHERSLIGEFDGAGKYLKEEYLRGAAPGDVVVAEKRREDWLRRTANADVMRWGYPELVNPSALRSLALSHGVPRAN